MLNTKKIEQIISETEESVKYATDMSSRIVANYTEQLDKVMSEIQTEIIDKEIEVPMGILENYFLYLSNTLYLIAPKTEELGLLMDISKQNANIAFNSAFSDNQEKSELKNKQKSTNTESKVYAENESVSETIVSYIYTRASKIVEAKIKAGYEMVKTLSKIISRRMKDTDAEKLVTSKNPNIDFNFRNGGNY